MSLCQSIGEKDKWTRDQYCDVAGKEILDTPAGSQTRSRGGDMRQIGLQSSLLNGIGRHLSKASFANNNSLVVVVFVFHSVSAVHSHAHHHGNTSATAAAGG
ncbi:hypothetical protein Fcan01_24727 [Folsomia candida]|uniref:Uncharacterized protein n=1 Tax=Folsomia candida TaxID=158441 RepID=A0A226D6V7_FOLCA|nr:hypothetical protein Fcan01_24727 [Folsomia candida]